jgi:hypothetical protein
MAIEVNRLYLSKFCEMSTLERLRKLHEEKTESWKLRFEQLFLAHGAVAVDCHGDCGDWIPSPGLD